MDKIKNKVLFVTLCLSVFILSGLAVYNLSTPPSKGDTMQQGR